MLTSDQFEQFRQDGYVLLDAVASDHDVEALRQRADDITGGRIRHEGMYFQIDVGGEYKLAKGGEFQGPSDEYRKIEGWETDPLFLAYMQHPTFRGITRQLVGEHVSIFRAMFMNKPANKGTMLPYHQDGGEGWNLSSVDGGDFVTIWTALDAATVENSCVEIVPGSHRLGLLSAGGHVISDEHEAEHAQNAESRYLELGQGEVAVLHNFLLHRAGVNSTDRPRRGFSACYMNGGIYRIKDRRPFPMIFGELALTVADAQDRMTA